jgi:hypothetical protein
MSTPTRPTTADATNVATAHCDVCSVAREPGSVVIRFGQCGPSAFDPRVMAVELRHRVTFGDGVAARLQDQMTALLNEVAESRGSVR